MCFSLEASVSTIHILLTIYVNTCMRSTHGSFNRHWERVNFIFVGSAIGTVIGIPKQVVLLFSRVICAVNPNRD